MATEQELQGRLLELEAQNANLKMAAILAGVITVAVLFFSRK